MALTAKEVLQEAMRRGLLDAAGARRVVEALKQSGGSRKFNEVLSSVGGLGNRDIRLLYQSAAEPKSAVKPRPRPRRRPPRRSLARPKPAGGSKGKKIAIIAIAAAAVIGIAVAVVVIPLLKSTPSKGNGSKSGPAATRGGGGNGGGPGNGRPTQPLTALQERIIEKANAEIDVYLELGDYKQGLDYWDYVVSKEKPEGEFLKAVRAERQKLVERISARWDEIVAAAQKFIGRRQFDAAHLTYMRALRFGLPEYEQKAWESYRAMVKIENRWLSGSQKSLTELRAERESNLDRIRDEDKARTEFREALTNGDLAGARSIAGRFSSETLRGQAETMVALAEQASVELEAALKKKVGSPVSLAFEKGDDFNLYSGKLTSVSNGAVTIEEEDGPVTEKIVHLERSKQRDLVESDVVRGFYFLLSGDVERSRELLKAAGKEGVIEVILDSPSWIGQNVDRWWARARSLENEKNRKYHEAHRILTLLLASNAVPERRRLEILELRAECEVHMGDFAGAMLDVETLLDQGNANQETLGILSYVLNRQGLLDDAVGIVEHAVAAYPKQERLYGTLLRIYILLNRRDDAARVIKEAPEEARNFTFFVTLKNWLEAQDGCFSGDVVEKTVGHYRVQTDAGDAVAEKVGSFMNDRYAEYSRMFPFPKNEDMKFRVKVFKKRSDFNAYHEKLSPDLLGENDILGGYFDPVAKELVMPKGMDLYETLRHEGFHQVLNFFVGGAPKWYNEGTASYFETSTVDERKMNASRMRSAQQAFKEDGAKSLAQLLTWTQADWDQRKSQSLLYGQSWSVIYYLNLKGRQDVLDRFFKILMRGERGQRAYYLCFQDLLKASNLNGPWRRWVENHDTSSND